MNRRGFLGSIIAAITAVRLPAPSKVAAVTALTNAGGTFEFIGPQIFDYGFQMGLALKLPDGRMHAVRTGAPRKGADGKFWPRPPDAGTVIELKRYLLDWAAKQYGVKA